MNSMPGSRPTGENPFPQDYNSHSNLPITHSALSCRTGAYLFSRAALPLLLAAASSSPALEYPPTLIFTGATASVKGSALCSSFATGKFAMRALAQSLAREFGPKGVHVAHAIIDGVIDIPRTKEWKLEGEDAKISPEAVSLTRRIFFLASVNSGGG